jgi:Asp-tRNA(Asn)/Glu-tRNA(Gln) amidotransferase A subunit family amidase
MSAGFASYDVLLMPVVPSRPPRLGRPNSPEGYNA